MNKRQKIIVSVTGIFIVLLILVGLTYAYFLTNIRGNTNTKSVEVTTANLVLQYGENTNQIQGKSNAEPGYSVTKYFTATNDGNADVDYVATLDSVVNELTRQGDLEYTLTCASYLKSGFSLAANGTPSGTIDGTCNGVDATQFPSTSSTSIMVGNRISTTQVHYYVLTINYKEMGVNQNADMNKTFSALVNIKDIKAIPNPYQSNTSLLSYNIINNALTGANGEVGSKLLAAPITKPAEEATMKYKTEGSIATSTIDMPISTTYQNYYWTYGTGYTIDETTGKFTLTGVQTCKYNDSDPTKACPAVIVDKYIVSNSASWNSSSTNTVKKTSNLSSVYKVVTVPVSTTTTITSTIKQVTNIPYSAEKVLSVTPDDYGMSYYYRGGVEDNYLNYSGMCWRIVRIEGDGSIKLILADPEGVCSTNSITLDNDSALLGTADYGYDNSNNADYLNSQNRTTSMKYKLDKFLLGESYDSYSSDGKNIIIKDFNPVDQSKLKMETWCLGDQTTKYNDRTGAILTNDELRLMGRAGFIHYKYDAGKRLFISPKTATLKCGGETFPSLIGTLTSDEIVFAGDSAGIDNHIYYLNDNAKPNYWWSLSLIGFDDNNDDLAGGVYGDAYLFRPSVANVYGSFRSAVTLSSSVEILTGDGTINNPYTLK